MKMILVVLFLFGLLGCTSTHPPVSTTSKNISEAILHTESQSRTLTNLDSSIKNVTPANVEAEKPKMTQLSSDALNQNKEIGLSLGLAEKGATKDQKTITSLATVDPVKVSLRLWGTIILLAGLAGLISGFFFATYIPGIAPILRSGGIAAIVLGICAITIAAFLTAIYWIFGAILVSLGVWVWFHRTNLIPAFTTQGKKIEAIIKQELSNGNAPRP